MEFFSGWIKNQKALNLLKEDGVVYVASPAQNPFFFGANNSRPYPDHFRCLSRMKRAVGTTGVTTTMMRGYTAVSEFTLLSGDKTTVRLN